MNTRTEAAALVTALLEGLERTSAWPPDFQQILYDYAFAGARDLPEFVPVKTVPIGPLLAQAQAMKYHSGDDRSQPDYQHELTQFVQGGGAYPPLIVNGKKLVDGRHRLLALAGQADVVRVIDLQDIVRQRKA